MTNTRARDHFRPSPTYTTVRWSDLTPAQRHWVVDAFMHLPMACSCGPPDRPLARWERPFADGGKYADLLPVCVATEDQPVAFEDLIDRNIPFVLETDADAAVAILKPEYSGPMPRCARCERYLSDDNIDARQCCRRSADRLTKQLNTPFYQGADLPITIATVLLVALRRHVR